MDWDDFTDKLSVIGEKTGRMLKNMFGSENERMIRRLEPLVAKVNELEPWAQGLEQAEMVIEVQKKLSALLGLAETKPGAPR